MCGIFGVLEHDPTLVPDRCLLEESAELLAHRGPDHCGLYHEPGIGLAHTRLSLLDLSHRSNQPLWDSSGRYAVVYNGEIYNFKTMRAKLEQKGIRFKTTSDTEVLLESIIHTGLEETLPALEGMYAFAFFDKQDRSLALVRDRFGIKPLFYLSDPQSFIFASELRAFLPWRNLELDTLRAAGFLIDGGSFTRGFTLLKGARSVEPGTIVKVRQGEKVQTSRFFVLTDLWDEDQQEELKRLSFDSVVDQVEESFLEAVDMQQFADASIGALCSGGLDSSLTVAMASRFQKDIQIFHAHTPGKDSELEFAQSIANHLKLDLRTVDLKEQDHIDLIPETILHRGTPFVDLPSSIPFLKVSRLVRKNEVKGVLTGEGADELFWGFTRMIPNLPGAAKRVPRHFYRLATRAMRRLAGRKNPSGIGSKKNLIYGLFSRFDSDLVAHETRQAVVGESKNRVQQRDIQSLFELGFNLRPLLNRNDSCGMAASIESRFPYLDYNLVKLAVNLPTRHKIHFDPRSLNPGHPFMIDKWVLRKVADRHMPRSLSRRYKVPWPSSAHSRLEISRQFFEQSFVRDLFEFPQRELDYLTKFADQSLMLKLMHFEVWAQIFLHGTTPEQMVKKLREQVAARPQ